MPSPYNVTRDITPRLIWAGHVSLVGGFRQNIQGLLVANSEGMRPFEISSNI